MKRKPFAEGEFYHIYNHGVEERNIFSDEYDSLRFLESMVLFNTEEPIGSIYEQSFLKDVKKLGGETSKSKLVNIIAYCLNPNHFHLLLEQVSENGVSEFMQRLGGGYTMYFNNRHRRRGALFRGVFRSAHVNSNEYLLHLSAYINLNFRVHQLGGETSKLIRSSWEEYIGIEKEGICDKTIIFGQMAGSRDYKIYAEDALLIMLQRKESEREVKYLSID
jgi:REP element-mobilizing transposase RayT